MFHGVYLYRGEDSEVVYDILKYSIEIRNDVLTLLDLLTQ